MVTVAGLVERLQSGLAITTQPLMNEAADRIEALEADKAKLREALAPFVDFWEWDTVKTFMDYPVSQCFTPATFLRAVKTFHETSETFTRSSDT
jgi:hypothetical protein